MGIYPFCKLNRWIERCLVIIHVTQAHLSGPYSLSLTFDNGVSKRINLRSELYGRVFEPLSDPEYFAQFHIENGTVVWPNGSDFAPDFLYNLEPAVEQSAD